MIFIEYGNLIKNDFINEYKDKIIKIEYSKYKETPDWPINYIEELKKLSLEYDIIIVPYIKEMILFLDTLKISFIILYSEDNLLSESEDYNFIINSNFEKIAVNDNIIEIFKSKYDWINIKEDKKEDLISIPKNKNKLTFEELLNEDIEITEADVRELKATQNKLKVGMLLQAKNSLNRVLKLSNILDKLYEKLFERIDNSIDTTDTASLMYTTEYIAKALNETNQFIISLINNEKIQNFFIIDNSSIVNINQGNNIDLNSREKIRKAAEIVLDNLDYFVAGDFQNIKDPNIIDITEETKNGNNTTESI